MDVIYVISSPSLARKKIYKIGIHKGSKLSLLSRYRTYLINPKVFYFYQHSHNKLIEKKVLTYFDKQLIVSNNNRKTEWINSPLDSIINIINHTIVEFDTIIKIEQPIQSETKIFFMKNSFTLFSILFLFFIKSL